MQAAQAVQAPATYTTQGPVSYLPPAIAQPTSYVPPAAVQQQVTYAAPVGYAPQTVSQAPQQVQYQPQQVQYTAAPSQLLQMDAQEQQPAQAVVKAQVGFWRICQDEQGEFYQHATSGETFDQPPPELQQFLQMQSRG